MKYYSMHTSIWYVLLRLTKTNIFSCSSVESAMSALKTFSMWSERGGGGGGKWKIHFV
jgi:hypothetical protein